MRSTLMPCIMLFWLQKCLNTIDLTSLGVGSCLGTGMYVVTGLVARRFAGPAVILSFIIAAVASLFSGKQIQLITIRLVNNIILSSVRFNQYGEVRIPFKITSSLLKLKQVCRKQYRGNSGLIWPKLGYSL